MNRALEGLRALDLTRGFGGALVTLVLADYGAEVIRIEPPDGDPLRREPAFPFWQRGKRSVVLDLAGRSGREDAARLAGASDLLVENFRPGVADGLGLGYAALSRDNPGLVYTSIRGFGNRGPDARLKGYEGVVMARLGGMAAFEGVAPRPGPAFPGVPYASFSAAHTALQGTLAALYVRERTGRGQRVETSLVQAMTAHDPWDWFVRIAAERSGGRPASPPARSGRGVPAASFAFRLLVGITKDGRWLQFSQFSPHLFRDFMEVLGLDWMWDDPEWSTAPEFETEDRRERFWEQLLEATRSRTLAEWEDACRRHPNVWCELFRTPGEVLDHPQMQHNGHVTRLDDPVAGPTRQLAPFVRSARAPAAPAGPAPRPGEHTREVLRALRAGALRPAAARGRARPPAHALDGVTVLELGLWYAAPYGPSLLADLGARVIKVEPLAGDPMRHVMPFPDAGAIKVLQGKESVALDLAHQEGQAIVRRLARSADLAVMSYRAGVAERFGVDAASLRRENPELVYLNAPGYGVDGPCGRRPAFAPTIGAATGAGRLQAGPSLPVGPGLPLETVKSASLRLGAAAQSPGNADGCSALGVATALLLGLVARERTGRTDELLTSMLCTSAYAVSEHCTEVGGRTGAGVADAALLGRSALYRLYPARSGWVFLAAPREREWAALCAALAPHDDLAADARFLRAADRAANDAALAERLARVFRTRDAADWERELRGVDVACVELAEGPVSRATLEDPVSREAGLLTEVEHPSYGRHRRFAPLADLSLTPGEARPACLLGQHTESVLLEHGYHAAAIAQLEERGVIRRGSVR